MAKSRAPVTPAVRLLRREGVAFSDHVYDYEERGGAPHAASTLGLDLHQVIKTLVLEDESGAPLLVLMHGDCEVSTRTLARHIGARSLAPCAPEVAQKHTGYLVGGTSPFGTRKPLPVYAEKTIFDLPRAYLNGGKRGYLIGLDPAQIERLLHPVRVAAAQADAKEL